MHYITNKPSKMKNGTGTIGRLLFTIAAIALYTTAFFLLYPVVGVQAAALAVLPIIVVSWFWGWRLGLIAGLLLFPLNTILFNLVGLTGWDTILRSRGGIGHLALILIGVVVGQLSDMRKRINHELAKRRQMEEKLKKSQEYACNLIDSSLDMIIAVDGESKIVEFNRAAQEAFGYSPEEISGKNINVLYEDSQAELKIQETIKQTGRFTGEVTHKRKNGETFPSFLSASILRDNEGKVVGIMAVSRDITAEKRAEKVLKESEARYRDLFENANDLIQSVSPEGRFIYVNRAWRETLGYSAAEIPDLSVFDIIHPESQEHCRQIFERLMSGEQFDKVEAVFVTKDGKEITVEGNINCKFVAGKPVSTRGIFRDITERKEIERLKDEFISIVSHELRTPLTSIVGSLGLIVSGAAGKLSEEATMMVEIAHRNSERLVALVNDILDIEKIESGKMEFHFQLLELMPLVEQALEANRDYAEQFGVKFSLKQILPGSKVNVDSDRLMQVFTNLLSNAAKYSPENGMVEISVSRHDKSIRVAITDHGLGIPADFRDRIFQKFAQADSSDTRQKGGTGLGLSIAKAIVERHGGKIDFTTESDVGTTFYFDLPEYNPPVSANLPELPILICENNTAVALLIDKMLKQSGFSTDIAANIAQAQKLLTENQYAAMTLNLMLPDGDGIMFIRALRQQESTRSLPIVVVSGRAEEGRGELNGEEFLVIDWIEKPSDEIRLIESVKRAVTYSADGKSRILHIEDDLDILQVVSAMLQDTADVVCAVTLKEAKQKLEQQLFDLIILDLFLPDGNGLELLPILQNQNPSIPVIIFSVQEVDKETARKVAATLVKSRTSNQKLLDTIKSLVENRGLNASE